MASWRSLWARRWVRRGAAALIAGMLVAAAAYSGFWFYAAAQIKTQLGVLAASAKANKIDLTWQAAEVGGYPFRFRVRLTGLHVKAAAGIDAAAPRFVASAQPGDLANWRFGIPGGLDAAVAGAVSAKLSAKSATGAISLHPDGGSTVWLTLDKSTADTGIASLGTVSFDQAITWLILPAQSPKAATDPYLSVAAELRGVIVQMPPPPFSNHLDDVALGVAVLGPVPAGSLSDAVSGWRGAGGTLKLDHGEIAWDKLDITGHGNVSLDSDLQPSGSLTLDVAGYDQLLTALSVAGLVAEKDVTPLKLGLAMIGPAISTFVTVKDGEVFLGPLNLGKAPKIEWK